MTDVFVLRNQHNQFLNKSLEWIAAGESKTLYRTQHKDEMINQKVELTVKRPDLRIEAVHADQATNGRIMIDGEDCLPKAEANPAPEPELELEAELHSEPELHSKQEPHSESEQQNIESALNLDETNQSTDSECS